MNLTALSAAGAPQQGGLQAELSPTPDGSALLAPGVRFGVPPVSLLGAAPFDQNHLLAA